MSLGKTIRQVLGPLEVPVANLYRDYFIDLDELVVSLSHLDPPNRILEIGCGDGFFANRLLRTFPSSEYLGIDIAGEPGRLFAGDSKNAEFALVRVEDIHEAGSFDMVLLIDVLHHVPPSEREPMLRRARDRLSVGGHLVIKEWERRHNPGHAVCVACERFVGGEDTEYLTRAELVTWMHDLFPTDRLVLEARVPPRRNNLLLVLEKR